MDTPSILVRKLTILSVILVLTVDANNPPRFVNWKDKYEVFEDKAVGSVLFTMSAVDDELALGKNLIFAVDGEPANKLLEIVQKSPTTADVKLKSPLDRETIASYDFLFSVSDNASTVSARLLFTVKDVNDNAPRFSLNTKFSIDVLENTAPQTIIYNISAEDPDEGYGGNIRYSLTNPIVPNQPGQPEETFSININNGSVILKKTLDYEKTKIYQLDITAADRDGLNSTTVLVIYVKDVQDTAPRFFSAPYSATIAEDADVGKQILQVSAQDGDVEKGVANPIKFKFTAGSNKYFNIDATSGRITLKTKVDREEPTLVQTDGLVEFQVTAYEDTQQPAGPTEATAFVRITVTDINDEAPTFNSRTYTASVNENTQKDVPITLLPAGTEITVSDKDKGNNGKFRLEIRKDGDLFPGFAASPSGIIFNEATVLVRVNDSSVLDFETTRQIKLQIVARETSTQNVKFSSADLTVNILDMNDHFPSFAEQTYNATISENAPKGTTVTTIKATDGDQGTYGELTYKLKGANSEKFTVDAKTGVITTSKDADKDSTILDRETVDTYFLSYEAVDGGNYRVTTSLEIHLADKNDNKPQFVSQVYDDGLVKEGQSALERIIQVQARDRDLGLNQEIVYSIIAGDPDKNFTVNAATGVIGLTAPLDFEKLAAEQLGKFNLTVQAKDKGTPPLDDIVQVIIKVEDENDNAPYFNTSKFTASTPEDSPPGTLVTTVTALDKDRVGSSNSELIYRIETGALDKFRINGQTGVITVETGANLDRDRFQKLYSLRVVAIDRGTPSLTGTCTVEISVTDVNNKLPTFSKDSIRIQVVENEKVNEVVYTYVATDLDENSNLVYSLLTDQTKAEDEDGKAVDVSKYNYKELFDIHTTNGSVYVKKSLDRESASEITLKIHVSDTNAANPKPQEATATLTIDIGDVNDNPPEFKPTNQYSGSVSEGAQSGDQVFRIVAVDRDKGTTVKYRIKSDPSQSVEIKDENDGVVTLKKTIDRETSAWLNFTVLAIDSGATPQSSEATISLQIKDINDNSPSFEPHKKDIYIAENTAEDTVIVTVKAVDRDTGSYASILYSITQVPADGSFGINQNSGGIRLVKALDRETQARYTLVITASDNNGTKTEDAEPRQADTRIEIHVTDINDNPPRFGAAEFTKNIQETAVVDDVIAPYTASDPDEGKNADITYSFDDAKSNGTTLFNIDSKTGGVSPKVKLDEHIGCFILTLVATDAGTPQLKGSSELTLCVVDLNNNPPKITVPAANNATFLIPEGAPAGTKITTIVATDPDQGPTNKITFSFAKNLADQKKYWEEFVIDPVTGEITTKNETDHERIPIYYLQVIVNDTQFDARRDIQVKVLDKDDNPPLFDRTTTEEPYPMIAPEESIPPDNGFVGTIPKANDMDTENNSAICYYIVGGDDADMAFTLDRNTGKVYLRKILDRESLTGKSYIDLVVKARKVCSDDYDRTKVLTRNKRDTIVDKSQFQQEYNASDKSLMLIRVTVQDVNDSPPEWLRQQFNAGVTKDTQIYEEIFDFKKYVRDNDTQLNSIVKLFVDGEIDVTPVKLKQQVEQKLGSHEAFRLNADTGVLTTNMYFEAGMAGYFSFKVKANDSASHSALAQVMVYLLNDEQRVKAIFMDPVSVVGAKKDDFAEFLSSVIPNATIIVDRIATRKTKDGRPDDKYTDMFLHAVNNETGRVLPAGDVLALIDENHENLVAFFKNYSVIEVVLAVEPTAANEEVGTLRLALIVTAVALGVLLIFLIIILICCRKKYRRKLKAATAMAFENGSISGDSGRAPIIQTTHPKSPMLNNLVYDEKHREPNGVNGILNGGPMDGHLNKVDMPGTNMHAYEGHLSPIHARVRNSLALVTDDTYKYFSCGENVLPRSNPIWMETYQNQWAREEDIASKNSLDENALDPNVNKVYDEQEITLDLYNDEYDNYNKVMAPEYQNGGFINAALEEHENNKNHQVSNGVNNNVSPDNRLMNGKGTFGGRGATPPLGGLETTEI